MMSQPNEAKTPVGDNHRPNYSCRLKVVL